MGYFLVSNRKMLGFVLVFLSKPNTPIKYVSVTCKIDVRNIVFFFKNFLIRTRA